MARICVDARMIHNSGIGVYIRHYLYYLLNNTSFELVILGRKAELVEYFGQFLNWKHIEADFPIYSIQEQIQLSRLIPYCDVFWSPHYNIPLLPIRARKRLVTIPDVFHLANVETLTFPQKIYARLVTNAAVRMSDKILTISQFSVDEIIRLTGVSSNKVKPILLGLDDSLFRQINDKTVHQQVRTKYNLPEQYILFVGNVKPNKNLRSLVEAFSLIENEFPNCHLLIAGKKDGFVTGDKTLFDWINANPVIANKVLFSGYVALADLPVLYSMATVFGFPSLYEGFGFPPLEAMACGCPVVASNRGSIPEICGDAAFYVNPTEPDTIAQGLRKVLTDQVLRKQLIRKGLAQVKRYNWVVSQQKFVEEIEQLL